LRESGENRQETGESQSEQEKRQWVRPDVRRIIEQEIIANTYFNTGGTEERKFPEQQEQRRHMQEVQGTISERVDTNTKCERLQKSKQGEQQPLLNVERNDSQDDITNTPSIGVEGGRAIREQEPRIQIEEGVFGCHNPGTDWANFPTQSPVHSRDDGISSRLAGITFPKHRNESIKAYGNAIVPQVAYQIFKAIELCD
jgi:DNA (cytosine-5)-methyltransferase 1